MKKTLTIPFAILLFISNFAFSQNSHTVYPRTIKATGTYAILLDIDELDIDFNMINESEVNKIKMPLDKVENQLKQYMASKGVPKTKLIVSTDPTMCSATYKSCTLKGLTLSEYNAIYPYFSKHLFTNSYYVTSRTIYKSTLTKNFDKMLQNCVQDAKSKAEKMASYLNEKIDKIQSIESQNVFLNNSSDYKENSGSFDSIQNKISFSNSITAEYALVSPENSSQTIFLPRTLSVLGTERKAIKNENTILTFRLGLIDYEEGDVKSAFEKVKNDLNKMLLSNGVAPSDIKSKKYSDYDAEALDYAYTVNVNGYNKAESINNSLSLNKNVSSILFENPTFSTISIEKYNQEMTLKAIADAEMKAQKLSQLFGVSIVRKFDVTDFNIAEDFDYLNSGLRSTLIDSKLSSLTNTISKSVYINYEIK